MEDQLYQDLCFHSLPVTKCWMSEFQTYFCCYLPLQMNCAQLGDLFPWSFHPLYHVISATAIDMCRYRPSRPAFITCNCKQQKLGMETWDEAIYVGVSEESFCVHTPTSLLWSCLVNELVETYRTTFSLSTIAPCCNCGSDYSFHNQQNSPSAHRNNSSISYVTLL